MMLSITRKPGQSFTIGPDITVRVTSVRGAQVRIDIEAPKHLAIERDDAKRKEPRHGR